VSLNLALVGSADDPRLGLRAAMGQTSTLPDARQLNSIVALDQFTPSTCLPGFNCQPPPIHSERQREWETGFDASLPGDRFTIGFSIYARRNVHELVPTNAAPSIQSPYETLFVPDALVTDRGLEFSTSAKLVDRPTWGWSVALDASENTNRVLRLDLLAGRLGRQQTTVAAAPDHPIYGVWTTPYTYSDANHDGVIEPNEVTVGYPYSEYVGSAVPTHLASASMSLAMMHRWLRFNTVFDYRGGYVLPDMAAYQQGLSQSAEAVNEPGASLSAQAAAIGASRNFGLPLQRVSATRWRELSATVGNPGAKTIQLTLAVRNLSLWTKYRGDPDWEITLPETFSAPAAQLPEPRTWLLRVTAGF
jgi:hypothetical protein